MIETEYEYQQKRIKLRNLAATEDALRVRGNDWTAPYEARLLDLANANKLQTERHYLTAELMEYVNREREKYMP